MFRRSIPLVVALSLLPVAPPGVLCIAAAQELPAPQTPPDTTSPEPTPTMQSLLDGGEKALNESRYPDALRLFGQARVTTHEARDKAGAARALFGIGNVYKVSGQAQKALDAYQQALPLYQQIGDIRGEGNALGSIGFVYNNLGQPQKGLDYFQRLRSLTQKLGDKAWEGSALVNIALMYRILGKPQRALDSYQQALPLYQQIGDKRGEGDALGGIGFAYNNLGKSQRALDSYQQALPLCQQIGDIRGEGNVLDGIGSVYKDSGQWQKGLDYFQQLLRLTQQLDDKPWESNALNNIALVYRGLGQPQKAVDVYQQALKLAQQTGDKRGEADILYGIGDVYLNLGQPQKALDYYQQVLTMTQQYGDTMMDGGKFNGIGAVYLTLGQPQKALDAYQKALTIAQKNADKQAEAGTLARLGGIYHALKRFGESETAYRQSLSCYEQIRASLNLDAQARANYFEIYLSAYQGLVGTLLAQATPAKTQEAFTLTQQMKGRSLTEMLAGHTTMLAGHTTLNAQLTTEERSKLRELRAVCDRLNAHLVAEGITNEIGSRKRAEEIRTDLDKAERDLSLFTDQLYVHYPDAAVSHAAHAANAKQVADALPPDAALVEFVTGINGEMVAFVITPSGLVGAYVVTLPPDGLAKAVMALRAGVVDPRAGNGQASGEEWKAPAHVLYDALIAPMEKAGQLGGVSRLVICPTGPLWDVPFATLLDDKNRSLLSRFTLTQAQSATIYMAARDRAREQGKEERNPNTTLLAFANPAFAEYKSVFGNDPALPEQRPLPAPDRPLPSPDRPLPAADRPIPSPDRPIPAADRALLLPESLRGGRLSALPGTRREADAIHATFPNAAVFVGSNAQESTVKQLAPKYRYLHLATHGFVNDTSPLLSSLILAEPPREGKGSDEDGFLTARELLDLDLSKVEMVTLSACNTARGQNQRGEGVVGLTWALFAAGCPTQVLSQWAVNDNSTATLMARFYANLKAGKPKAEALRQAALSVSRDPGTAHPYYWAPFVLFGSGG